MVLPPPEHSKAVQMSEDITQEGFHSHNGKYLRSDGVGGEISDHWMHGSSSRRSLWSPTGTGRSRSFSPKGSHRRRDPYGVNPYGRLTPSGRSVSPRPQRFRLDAGERQQHMTLWSRRMSTEGVSRTKAISYALTQRSARDLQNSQQHSARRGQTVGPGGPSYATELADDPRGVAFAFGGVDPGTLHAGGKLVRVHAVHYSVGRAGTYLLHVGLRQQSAMIAGSPFELNVSPGIAHYSATRLANDGSEDSALDLPLKGTVGKVGKGFKVITYDRMSNRCLVGGAPVRVHCNSDKVQTSCMDKGDGTYTITWHSDMSGSYMLSVTIEGSEVVGSPVPMIMQASSPQVAKFQVFGKGLERAVAGQPATLRIEGQDDFGNLCDIEQISSMIYGVAIVANGSEDSSAKKKAKADRAAAAAVVETIKEAGKAKGMDPRQSMDFKDRWVDGLYEIEYVAQKAGYFSLHVWCVPKGGERERLPGSPFSLTVNEGQANPSGCFIKGADLLRDLSASEGGIEAGKEVSVQPHLRDKFGNPSSATDGALTATLDGPLSPGEPDGTIDLSLRQLTSGTGAGPGVYEVTHTPELQGSYTLHVKLYGQPISDSPITFTVTSGGPHGGRSRIIPPTDAFFVGVECKLLLETIDKFGNKVGRGGANPTARAVGNAAGTCTVEDLKDGTYAIRFTQNAVGDCKVIARVDGTELTPVQIAIEPKGGAQTALKPKKEGTESPEAAVTPATTQRKPQGLPKSEATRLPTALSESQRSRQGGGNADPSTQRSAPSHRSGKGNSGQNSHRSLGSQRSSSKGSSSTSHRSSKDSQRGDGSHRSSRDVLDGQGSRGKKASSSTGSLKSVKE